MHIYIYTTCVTMDIMYYKIVVDIYTLKNATFDDIFEFFVVIFKAKFLNAA